MDSYNFENGNQFNLSENKCIEFPFTSRKLYVLNFIGEEKV
jgi:hypothetical protein